MVSLPDFSSSGTFRQDTAPMQRFLHDHWKFYAFQGGLLCVVGILALVVPLAATLASTIFFGWLMLLGGAVGLLSAIRARNAPGFWSHILLAALSVLLGGVILWNPMAGAVTLTWVLALYFLLVGIASFSIAGAVRDSTSRHVLLIASGVLNVALALMIVLGLPGTAVWAIGVFLGISFLSSGVGLLMSALDARKTLPSV